MREAAGQGWKLLLVMAGCEALFVLMGVVFSPAARPSVSPHPSSNQLPSVPIASYQLLVHVVTGFAAGAVSLDPSAALVGGAVGPLIDLDHLGNFAGLHVDARVGHSLFLVALVVLLDSRLRFWGRGTRNLLLFMALEYSVHFAVAPAGFPLFAPLSFATVYFPRAYPAALAVVVAVAFLFDSMGSRMRASPRKGAAQVAG